MSQILEFWYWRNKITNKKNMLTSSNVQEYEKIKLRENKKRKINQTNINCSKRIRNKFQSQKKQNWEAHPFYLKKFRLNITCNLNIRLILMITLIYNKQFKNKTDYSHYLL